MADSVFIPGLRLNPRVMILRRLPTSWSRRLQMPVTALTLADYEFAAARIAKKPVIFVAGPYVDAGWTEIDLRRRCAATRLRRNLIRYIEQHHGCEVIIGEHEQIRLIGERNLGKYKNPVSVEMGVIKLKCDIVFVLPSSPGSFCEIGAWSNSDEIIPKLAIIGNKRFENGSSSYFNSGIITVAKNDGSRMYWISYRDLERAKSIVDQEIDDFRDRYLDKQMRS